MMCIFIPRMLVFTDPGGAASDAGMVWAEAKCTLAINANPARTVFKVFEVFISRWDFMFRLAFLARLELGDLKRVRKKGGAAALVLSVFIPNLAMFVRDSAEKS